MKKNWSMLVVLGLSATATGCDFNPGSLPFGGGGQGADGGNGGAGGQAGEGGSSGAVVPECMGQPDGTPLAAQTPGDCVVQVCDGNGKVRVELSPTDANDDNPCTKDECIYKEPQHTPLAGFTLAKQVVGDCVVKQCNAMGVVEDVPDDTDTGETSECSMASCAGGKKVTDDAYFGAACGPTPASWCNGGGKCVNWCGGGFGFSEEPLQAVGPHYYAVATGDVDNDGKPDLVFGDYDGSTFRVMLGIGDGKFGAPIVNLSASCVTSFALAELDGKNGLDVVVSERCQDNLNDPGGVHVFFNNGSGTFGSDARYTTGKFANEVTAADMNGDGKIDLAVANYNGGNVSVLLNQGNGAFGPPVNYGAINGPTSVVAAYLNDDGYIDLAVTNAVGNGVSLLFGAGNGTFSGQTNFSTGFLTNYLTTADVDGNGKSDLVVSYASGVAVLRNQGNANFDLSTYPTGTDGGRLTTADLNDDGILDIAATNFTSGTVSTLRNKGNGTFEEAVNYAMGNLVHGVVAADFTGDGKPDLVASNNTQYLRMLKNDGTGKFLLPAPHYDTGRKPTSIAARDFNKDDKPDLAVTNIDDNTVRILRNDGTGTFQSVGLYDVPGKPSTVVSDDFNGDGLFDLAVSESTRGYVAVLINQGNSKFAPPVEYLSGASNADAVVSADVNGDGHFDLLVAHRNGLPGAVGAVTLGVLLGDGKGVFAAPVTIVVGDEVVGTGRATLGVADLNGDNKPDVVVGRSDTARVYRLLNDGAGSFGSEASFQTDAGINFFAIADMDGDSWLDVVTNCTATMKNLGGGTAMFAAPINHTYYAGTVAIADLNGDNKPDMAEASATGAEINVFMNGGAGAFLPANHYAAGVHESYNGSIVALDLNADGRPDFAVIDDTGVSIHLSTCLP